MMAASSKPLLRSSARRNVGLEALAIGLEVPSTRSGKRTRESSLGSESNTSSKRSRFESEQASTNDTTFQSKTAKYLPIRDRSSAQNAVTQPGRTRKAAPALQALNGTTTSPSQIVSQVPSNATGVQALDVRPQVDKRYLRSADGGSRSKSELALYIPNYEELVSIEPKKPGTFSPLNLFKPLQYLADWSRIH